MSFELTKYRFELHVEGMTCVKCTHHISKGLKDLETPVENVKIDFITNRVLFTIANKDKVEAVIAKIKDVGYEVMQCYDITNSFNTDNRTLHLQILKGNSTLINDILYTKEQLLVEAPRIIGDRCTITYNPIQIRGSEIIQKLKASSEAKEDLFSFKIVDVLEDEAVKHTFSEFKLSQVILVLIFNGMLVAASFVRDEHQQQVPEKLGIYSYYFIATLILTTLNVAVVGLKIYKKSLNKLIRNFDVNMMTLVSLGSILALIFAIAYTIWGTIKMITGTLNDPHYFIMNGTDMYFTGATLLTAVVVGKYVEGRIKRKVYDRIESLKKQLKVNVDNVTRIIPKNLEFDILEKEDLQPLLVEKGDYILTQKTGMIPFDGFIEKGTLKIVENFQHGWEKVETKQKGHPIMSGSQVIEVHQEAIVRVTEPLEKTVAGRLFYEIKEAASGSNSTNKTADILTKVTKYFISTIVLIAILTAIGWGVGMLTHSLDRSETYFYPFEKAIAVMVASCPCALGIAIPMLYAIALRKAFKSGVMIKETSSLDLLNTVDTIVFDKTGTITGTYTVKDVQNLGHKYDDASLWEMICLLEKNHLQHPIGLALYQEALQRLSKLQKPNYTITNIKQEGYSQEYFASEGIVDSTIKINSEQKKVSLGNQKLLSRLGVKQDTLNPDLIIETNPSSPLVPEEEGEGQNNLVKLYLIVGQEVYFTITLSLKEKLKSNVMQLIEFLTKRKKTILILSGDNKANADQIGVELGIPTKQIYADMTPEDKETHIKHLISQEGKRILMVGDGINDIKAYKAATVSCSINFKSSQNLTFSDFIVIDNDVENISALFRLATALNRFKIIILIFALLYNVPVVLAASGAFVTVANIDLPAFLAAWAMVLFSLSLTVIANLMAFVHIKQKEKRKRH